MSFSNLKKQSSLGNLTAKLVKEVEKLNTNSNSDDRLWKPELDKSGNGYAVIRFLPAPDGEELPWAKMYSHAFQGLGGWYIEYSLTTLGKNDPVSEYNSKLWNSGIEANKEIARKQKRRLHFISNIYVVQDPGNPDNEGKVFLYKYGKKIFDKINDVMNPEFEDESPVNPFDFWEGTNFKLKIRKVEGFTNYDKSEFAAASALLEGDDKQLEDLWKTQYKLSDFLLPENFKSYEELQTRLDKVLNTTGGNALAAALTAEDEKLDNSPKQTVVAQEFDSNEDASDSDAMSYFAKLADED